MPWSAVLELGLGHADPVPSLGASPKGHVEDTIEVSFHLICQERVFAGCRGVVRYRFREMRIVADNSRYTHNPRAGAEGEWLHLGKKQLPGLVAPNLPHGRVAADLC